MNNITNIDDSRPHINIEASDGFIHVIPVQFFEDVRDGKKQLSDLGDFDVIAPAIVNGFLLYLGH